MANNLLITFQIYEYASLYVKKFSAFVELLPARESSICQPFSGFVLNVNVETNLHRDPKDLGGLCLVVPFGNFEGGELCLLEPGLVIPLEAGDMTLFHSSRTTHFNLPYTGTRGSLIMHSDAAAERWVMDRMGRLDNNYAT